MDENVRGVKPCPLDTAFEVVAGKWKARTISCLAERTLRFGELERRVPHVSRKVLVQQLRSLEADGVLSRTVHQEVPPRVEYTLTDRGRRLLPILQALETWGAEVLRGMASSVQCDHDGARAFVQALDGRVDRL
jgi:DNA-binding HxlR family transcriptional regulator